MDATLARLFACPTCRAPHRLETLEERAGRVLYGGLLCDRCQTIVPICAGFPLFPETALRCREWSREDLERIEHAAMGDAAAYAAFVRRKYRRPTRDAYAAFQPFNESTQALFALVPLLRSRLRPGAVILDLWCRTGWSGELLASLFPQQQVVSVWEGNSDVLGYRGFRYWLGDFARASNLDIIFHSPSEPLPLSDGSVALVHGLDTLHRYRQSVLVPEVLRLLQPDGAAVFPHVHLTNSAPVPYFDRGCLQRHGSDYRDYFARLLGDDRRAFVMSECDLFERGGDIRLTDNAAMSHYNALVAVFPVEVAGAQLDHAWLDSIPAAEARAVVNPMWTIDLHRATARVEAAKLDGAVGRLLERHPIYRERLARTAPVQLDEAECEILYWADRCLTLGETAARTHRPFAAVARTAAGLAARHVIETRAVSRAMAVLQRFYTEQTAIAPAEEQTLPALWRHAVHAFAERPLIAVDSDGSVFTYADANEITARAAAALARDGVAPGDVVCVCAPFGAEAMFVVWAAALAGAVLAPLDWSVPPARTAETLGWLRPKLLFCDLARLASLGSAAPCVVFDDGAAEIPTGYPVFADWIAPEAGDVVPAGTEPASDDVVLVLQTSGTSGTRKFIELSHGSLYRSAQTIARSYDWREDDVLLSTGELHAMSGFRNPSAATLFAGASFVVVGPSERRNPMALAEAVQRHGATILATVPGTLQLLTQYEGRLPAGGLDSLRLVLSTGGPLSPELVDAVRARFGLAVLDYYGLTELAGANIAVTPEDVGQVPRGSIGRAIGCIAQIVDDDGAVLPAGQVGELRILSENLMRGYRGDALTGARVSRGWCYTGDLAVQDEAGFVNLLSRRRDVIKDARGDLIHPAEVESVLLTHECVREAGVCGYTSADRVEKLAAFVVLHQASDDVAALVEQLRRYVLDQLGPFRVPAYLEVVDSLPRLEDGTLLRRELAARCS